MKALVVSEGQAYAIWLRFKLNAQKDWLKDVERGAIFPNVLLVPEQSDFYPYVEKSGLGVEIEFPVTAS